MVDGFNNYELEGFFDEMLDNSLEARPSALALLEKLDELNWDELKRRQSAAEKALLQAGITFNVYGADGGTERIFPFDIIPRIISAEDWKQIESGLKQRVHALNLFIDDIYHE